MTYEEIADADRRGFDIQLHTHSHRLDRNRPQEIRNEIRMNQEKLNPHVSRPLVHFCYPSSIYDPELRPFLQEEGIKSATVGASFKARLNDRNTDRFALSRFFDGEYRSTLEIEAELSGFLELLRPFKHCLERALPNRQTHP
jgi:peptidoglycan/xylan/chitin deacetylase (PgdA/CDA1 family)